VSSASVEKLTGHTLASLRRLRPAEAEHLLHIALCTLEAQHEDLGCAQAWLLLAGIDEDASQHARREEKLRLALAHAQRAGNEQLLSESLVSTADSLCRGATPAVEAIHRCEQILTLAGPNVTLQAGVLRVLSAVYAMQARHDRAHQLAREAGQIEGDLELNAWTTASLHAAVAVPLLAGDVAEAERRLRAVSAAIDASTEKTLHVRAAGLLAHILDTRGAHAEASEFAELAATNAGPDDIEANILWRSARAKLAARRREHQAAHEQGSSAVELAEATDDLNLRGDTLMSVATVARLSGRTEESARCIRWALNLYEDKQNLVSAGRARRALGQLARTAANSRRTSAAREEQR
jgi:hypothetical protein